MNRVDFFQGLSELKSSPHVFWRLQPHVFWKNRRFEVDEMSGCHSFFLFCDVWVVVGWGWGERSGEVEWNPLSKWDWNNGKTLWVLGGSESFLCRQGWVVFSDPKRGAFKEAQNPQNHRVDGIFFSPQVVFLCQQARVSLQKGQFNSYL